LFKGLIDLFGYLTIWGMGRQPHRKIFAYIKFRKICKNQRKNRNSIKTINKLAEITEIKIGTEKQKAVMPKFTKFYK